MPNQSPAATCMWHGLSRGAPNRIWQPWAGEKSVTKRQSALATEQWLRFRFLDTSYSQKNLTTWITKRSKVRFPMVLRNSRPSLVRSGSTPLPALRTAT